MSLLLKNVLKAYREPDGRLLPILNVADFALESGEQVVLVGPSGGGKTTLLNVIAGITVPDSGTVTIDGIEITRLHEVGRDRFRAQKIGFVFQTFNLLPAFTALENVLLGMSFAKRIELPIFTVLQNLLIGGNFSGKRLDRRHAEELLAKVGLSHRLHHRPAQLSVGEQQRVAVARALANRPSLLLADEPTANVDVNNQQTILDLIREACRENNVSLLMVTHSQEAASQFSRVIRLSEFNRPGTAA